MPTTIKVFTFNGFQENTIVVSEGNSAVIFDPGCSNRQEENALAQYLIENHLTLEAVWLTHAHLDHVFGLDHVVRTYQVPVYLHEDDIVTLKHGPAAAQLYGIPGFIPPPEPTDILKGGETMKIGEASFKVLFTPGHAPGHVVYYNKEEGYAINGDVLFAGSFGRYDLPGGNLEALKHSIIDTMFNLPEDTVVLCGHGPETTIGREKHTNPILMY